MAHGQSSRSRVTHVSPTADSCAPAGDTTQRKPFGRAAGDRVTAGPAPALKGQPHPGQDLLLHFPLSALRRSRVVGLGASHQQDMPFLKEIVIVPNSLQENPFSVNLCLHAASLGNSGIYHSTCPVLHTGRAWMILFYCNFPCPLSV